MKSQRSRLLESCSTALVVLAAALPAQTGAAGQAQNRPPQNPVPQNQQNQQNTPTEREQQQAVDPDLDNLIPTWRPSPKQPSFKGFPIFPSDLSGYGTYPRNLSEVYSQVPIGERSLVPAAPAPAPVGWPRWLKNESREPLPYQPDLALLVRNVDRVWCKPADEEAFVPLYFYDKLRAVGPGTQIEVRQVGEFELLLHGGSRVIAQGVTDLLVEELSEALVTVRLRKLTKLRLEAFGREHRVGLPDGSTIVMKPEVRPKADDVAAPPKAPAGLFGFGAPEGGTPFQPALLIFERDDEPGWRSGRATLWNGGTLPVVWEHAFGKTELASGERVTFFFAPTDTGVAAALASKQVRVENDGTAVRCEATEDGEVTWSGARFSLGKGAVLRLDPILGTPFTPPASSTRQ